MTPQQILVVAIRLFAVFWFLTSIGHLITALRAVDQVGADGFTVIGLLVPIFELFACVFLWFFPTTLSRRLLKGGDSPSGAVAPALLKWQAMIAIAMGLWTLSGGIPDAVYWIMYFASQTQLYASGDVFRDRWADIAATAVQIIIGVWLLFGARDLTAILFRMRTAGLRQ